METSHRLIASFGRRRGRKPRATKQGLLDTLLPELQIKLPECRDAEMQKAGLAALLHFCNSAFLKTLWLEIGFGSGEHLAAQAAANPHVGLIGCEPYINGLGNLLGLISERAGSHNIRLFTDDARKLLPHLPDASLARVFILFPDPWPKSRHHKRRLISAPFLRELARVMQPGAELRLATDHADYCAWMLEHLLACPHFEWTARVQADWQTPPADWVRTRYQEKAEGQGRAATYLNFLRKAS